MPANREREIVLRRQDVDRRSQEILDRYRIPADRSPDLLAMKPSPAVDPPAAAIAEVNPAEPPATPTLVLSIVSQGNNPTRLTAIDTCDPLHLGLLSQQRPSSPRTSRAASCGGGAR